MFLDNCPVKLDNALERFRKYRKILELAGRFVRTRFYTTRSRILNL